MPMGAFPEDPRARRVVTVLDEHEIENCSRNGETQILTDQEMHVLVFPVAEGATSLALTNILDAGLDRRNALLVQSPFDVDIYVDAADAVQDFSLAKHMLLSNFCQLLGATRVSITQMDIVTNDSVQSLKIEGGKLVVKGEFGIEKTVNDSLCSQLTLVDEYHGGEADLAGAEQLLRNTRLLGDSNMMSLLQSVKASNNRIKRRSLTVNLSTEANKNLKIVGRVVLPSATLALEYGSTVKQTKEYRLTVEVLFGAA